MRREVDAELFMPDFKRRLDQSQSALEEELSARIDTAAKVSGVDVESFILSTIKNELGL